MTHVTTSELIELFCDDAPDGDALEAHVFECDACGAAYARLGELCATLRTTVPPVISHAHRDRMLARGLQLRTTPVEAGVDVDVDFDPTLDFLIHRLRGDFSRASRVDLAIVGPGGAPVVLEHVPFSADEVLVACQRHYRDLFAHDPSFVVTVTEGDATRRASYRVIHHFPEDSP